MSLTAAFFICTDAFKSWQRVLSEIKLLRPIIPMSDVVCDGLQLCSTASNSFRRCIMLYNTVPFQELYNVVAKSVSSK